MIDGWQDRFTPLILARGRKYAAEGKVHHIQCRGDAYFATVSGTEDYEVEIVLGADNDPKMTCDCLYAYNAPCKHMAALLYSLSQEGTYIEQLPPPRRPPVVSHTPVDWPWLEAIEKLPEAVVRKELMKRADRDPRLRERLATLYLGRLPEHQLQNWKADLQDTAASFTNARGRISAEDSLDFLHELSYFLSAKLPLLLEAGATSDAFLLIWTVMETALEWDLDDYYETRNDLFSDCESAFKQLLPMTPDTQKQQMMKWYQANRDPDWPGGTEHLDRLFRKLFSESVPM